MYKARPTITRTVILPPGVTLNDERLASGVVTKETRSILVGSAVLDGWPDHKPFEADVDGSLLPPCKGVKGVHAHYAVYPDDCFANVDCGYCDLHKKAHPFLHRGVTLREAVQAAMIPLHEPVTSYADTHLTQQEKDLVLKEAAPPQKEPEAAAKEPEAAQPEKVPEAAEKEPEAAEKEPEAEKEEPEAAQPKEEPVKPEVDARGVSEATTAGSDIPEQPETA